MPKYTFTASRISGTENIIFPDQIIIDTSKKIVIHRKPRLIGGKETKIKFSSIASASCDKHILFADVYIETHGGREIVISGFAIDDAEKIVEILTY